MLTISGICSARRYAVAALLLVVLALSFGRQAIADDNWISCGLGYGGSRLVSQPVAAVKLRADIHLFYNVDVPGQSGGTAVQEAKFWDYCDSSGMCTPSWSLVGNVPNSKRRNSVVSAPSATVGGDTIYLVHALRSTVPATVFEWLELAQEYPDGHWTPWAAIPDPPFQLNADARPAVAFLDNVLYVFATTKDGAIQMIFNDLSGAAGWTSWSPITSDHPMASAPTAVALDDGDLYLLAAGTDQVVYYNQLIALPGSGYWVGWKQVPFDQNFVTDGKTNKPIGATVANGQLYIAISTPLTTLQFNVMTSPNSDTWAGFSDVSGEGFATAPALAWGFDLHRLYIFAVRSDSSGNDLLYRDEYLY
jgi:hypothetical protein